ncbi:uncharacterized protein STEHIDRAFT_111595 [Stereum hirsutum FP-91666 SS1]|uniref:uncharacterized protein n=1 Tax=Stereum hirsutum (strain FP-91666) TaxID=721885 RepID=UPI000444A667|nr:uncharacterized protein STEHIDRAFT_111595 [Stereum hirsutum FP-91666 SS1]EIM86049.1 hypothetical protein STEHIDRAFT_111595 [Stereum hirsutum FP-91666 SS1]
MEIRVVLGSWPWTAPPGPAINASTFPRLQSVKPEREVLIPGNFRLSSGGSDTRGSRAPLESQFWDIIDGYLWQVSRDSDFCCPVTLALFPAQSHGPLRLTRKIFHIRDSETKLKIGGTAAPTRGSTRAPVQVDTELDETQLQHGLDVSDGASARCILIRALIRSVPVCRLSQYILHYTRFTTSRPRVDGTISAQPTQFSERHRRITGQQRVCLLMPFLSSLFLLSSFMARLFDAGEYHCQWLLYMPMGHCTTVLGCGSARRNDALPTWSEFKRSRTLSFPSLAEVARSWSESRVEALASSHHIIGRKSQSDREYVHSDYRQELALTAHFRHSNDSLKASGLMFRPHREQPTGSFCKMPTESILTPTPRCTQLYRHLQDATRYGPAMLEMSGWIISP